uniref:Uncharacterized protein n=1 Tax=Sander lucioperca TaxID=283035 RepID=A0A8D0D5T9_SANLU
MPPKPLEPLAKKLMKGVIALELLGVFGVYGIGKMSHFVPLTALCNVHQMTGSENRFLLLCFLPVFYQSNEWAGVYGIRERDHAAWSAKQD